jgi:hypothetical protein
VSLSLEPRSSLTLRVESDGTREGTVVFVGKHPLLGVRFVEFWPGEKGPVARVEIEPAEVFLNGERLR